jgi:hypothetical protein
MKKTLLAFIAFSIVSVAAFSQNGIEVYYETETNDISGKTLQVDITNGDFYSQNLYILNNTGSSQSWIVTRRRMDVPGDWSDYLCWGHETDGNQGGCYPAREDNPWSSPDAINVLDSERAKLTLDIDPADANFVPGALYRYYFGPSFGAASDSVDVQFNGTLGIKQVKHVSSLSISPNPASESIFISLDGLDKGAIKIVDVLGNVVYTDFVTNGKKIDVSELKNGIYFLMIDASGYKTMTRKIIIRH